MPDERRAERPGLDNWTKARQYRERAKQARQLAEDTPASGVRERHLAIAEHYLTLAAAEERAARLARKADAG